jgi:ComF family protein
MAEPALWHARRWGVRVLDSVFPPRCIACGQAVEMQGAVCGECWPGLTFLAEPLCRCCGVPLPEDAPGEGVFACVPCATAPPAYRKARAAVLFDRIGADLVHKLKYADRTGLAPSLAQWMLRAAPDMLAEADAIVPVPLHRTRLWRRRFNQAALLALALARKAGKPVWSQALLRRKRTAPQIGLGRTGRAANVRHAFAVSPRFAEPVRGAHILLIDDVLTTGATAEACARVLLRAGAASVEVLTVARVPDPDQF